MRRRVSNTAPLHNYIRMTERDYAIARITPLVD